MSDDSKSSSVTQSQSGNPEISKFLLLLKGVKGAAAAEVVKQVLGSPSVFSFSELLQHENVKALKGGQFNKAYVTLELFAFGTYKDYDANKHIKLNDKQINKLKQLSIVTIAANNNTKLLYYKDLMKTLDIKTVRSLEDMIINCIYSDLIKGKLDQRLARIEINYVKGRDISTKDIKIMKSQLLAWLKNTETLKKELKSKQTFANKLTNDRRKMYNDVQKSIEITTKEIIDKVQAQKVANIN